MQNAPAPGWYPDPSTPGHERWWDGGAWTTLARPAPGLVAPPAAPAPRDATAWSDPRGSAPPTYPWDVPAGGSAPPPMPRAGAWGPAVPATPDGVPPAVPATPDGVPPAVPATPDGVPLAAPGARLGARVLDWLVISMVAGLLSVPFLGRAVDAFERWASDTSAAGSTQPLDLQGLLTDPDLLAASTTIQWVTLAVGLVYQVGFITWRGATPGKMAFGVRVRGWDAEGRPSPVQALLRWVTREGIAVVPFVGLLYLLLDSLWLLWDPRRQALHDKAPRTVVVRAR